MYKVEIMENKMIDYIWEKRKVFDWFGFERKVDNNNNNE